MSVGLRPEECNIIQHRMIKYGDREVGIIERIIIDTEESDFIQYPTKFVCDKFPMIFGKVRLGLELPLNSLEDAAICRRLCR
jgi:hypothetical protein